MNAGPWSGRRLHFVGIGGAGMSGLAIVARALGAEVTGSDRAPDSPYLARTGLTAVPHAAENVPEGSEVVYSSAIPPDNPERAAARERGLRELHRADLLGEITRLRPTIAVTGTHGKTTTSSMVVHALRGCGMDPAYLVGGEVRSTGANAGWGAGEWLVVEADESDRSLLKLDPRIAVLTNAELDHHATYSSQRDVDDTFRAFLALADEVVLGDEPGVDPLPGPRRAAGGDRAGARRLALQRRRRARLAAGSGRPQRPQRGGRAGRLHAGGRRPRGGRRRARGLRRRRPAVRAAGDDGRGGAVVDDYAHHPTEVRATIAAARAARRVRAAAIVARTSVGWCA